MILLKFVCCYHCLPWPCTPRTCSFNLSLYRQTDDSIPLYVLFISSVKYFNLEIRHWWNLYYTRMLGQDLLPTKHTALLSHNMLCGIALSSCDSWWPHSQDSYWLENGEKFQMARVWESRRWLLYVVIWVSFSGPVQFSCIHFSFKNIATVFIITVYWFGTLALMLISWLLLPFCSSLCCITLIIGILEFNKMYSETFSGSILFSLFVVRTLWF